eukprot:TRINITY_DN14785_c0_g1_i4.p1 TRINITY_DN14785_c0_g1~~TRINITY_DN14785_c0_g1_i4.p1  ORF type:complete len:368 (+),score=62.80 TRINITY_DN14785_c0_g1_i4:47-1150(+)
MVLPSDVVRLQTALRKGGRLGALCLFRDWCRKGKQLQAHEVAAVLSVGAQVRQRYSAAEVDYLMGELRTSAASICPQDATAAIGSVLANLSKFEEDTALQIGGAAASILRNAGLSLPPSAVARCLTQIRDMQSSGSDRIVGALAASLNATADQSADPAAHLVQCCQAMRRRGVSAETRSVLTALLGLRGVQGRPPLQPEQAAQCISGLRQQGGTAEHEALLAELVPVLAAGHVSAQGIAGVSLGLQHAQPTPVVFSAVAAVAQRCADVRMAPREVADVLAGLQNVGPGPETTAVVAALLPSVRASATDLSRFTKILCSLRNHGSEPPVVDLLDTIGLRFAGAVVDERQVMMMMQGRSGCAKPVPGRL